MDPSPKYDPIAWGHTSGCVNDTDPQKFKLSNELIMVWVRLVYPPYGDMAPFVLWSFSHHRHRSFDEISFPVKV